MLRDIFHENQNFSTEPALSLKFVTHINAFICISGNQENSVVYSYSKRK